jgi:thymidylate synthase
MMLYEALYMLAGRNDVSPLVYYAKQFKEYTDDGETFNGGYGKRWRHSKSYALTDDQIDSAGDRYALEPWDQIAQIIRHLKEKPESRRAVLQMWTVDQDLLAIDRSRDVCCNLAATFQMSGGWTHGEPRQLNLTVFNRSNDLIWGLLGANAVHFSVLLEYVAAHLGVAVGQYHQITTNGHVYESNWKPEVWLADTKHDDFYTDRDLKWPLLSPNELEIFDKECSEFVERHSKDALAGSYHCSFLRNVAQPLMMAFHHRKSRNYTHALKAAQMCWGDDWRLAAVEWLCRREANYVAKQTAGAK